MAAKAVEETEVGCPGKDNEACQECGRWRKAHKPFIKITARNWNSGSGTGPADIVEVGEGPGRDENKYDRNFAGTPGNYLTSIEDKVGIGHGKYRIVRTNAVRCYAEHKPTPAELAHCRPFVLADIRQANPKIVVALGAYALRTLTNLSNITKRQGIPIHHNGLLVLPVIHPAAVCRDSRNEKAFVEAMAQIPVVLRRISGEDSKIDELKKRYLMVMTDEQWKRAYPLLRAAKLLACDTEYEPLDVMDPNFTCLGLSFSWESKTGLFLPKDHPESPFLGREDVRADIVDIVENVPLAMHHAEADFAVLVRCLGARRDRIRVVFDTMKSAMVIWGKDTNLRLKSRAYVDADTGGYDEELEKWKREHPIKHGYSEIPLQVLGNPYAAGDTDTTWQLMVKHLPLLKKREAETFYYKVFLPGFRLNHIMQENGITLDWDEWNWRWQYWLERKREVYEKVLAIPKVKKYAEEHTAATKKKFSLKSRPQMLTLWSLLKLPRSDRKTDGGGMSLDQHALLEIQPMLEGHPFKPFVDGLCEIGEIDKTLGTYLEGFADDLRSDGRIHPECHNFTESTRRATSNPNVQNVPVKNPKIPDYPGVAGPKDPWNFRMMLRSAPGKILVVPDYGQLEFRLAACFCRDDNMIRACREADPHRLTKEWLSIPRKPAKTTNFQLIYGCGWERLQQEIRKTTGLEWSEEFTKEVIQKFKELYPGLFPYIDSVHAQVEQDQYVTTPLGHIRLFPHIRSDDKGVVERAKREAWNHKCQATGHDLLCFAMDIIQEHIFTYNLTEWLLLNDTHDGFYLEVPEAEAMVAANVCKTVMEATPAHYLGDWLQVPLPAEVGIGIHVGNLEELKL
jgi:DNA polymerase